MENCYNTTQKFKNCSHDTNFVDKKTASFYCSSQCPAFAYCSGCYCNMRGDPTFRLAEIVAKFGKLIKIPNNTQFCYL